MRLDYLIIGQGIAGSMMAHFLIQENKKVLVIDQHNPNSASNIAIGAVNPVTGRRMAKSWMIDELLPFAKDTYRELEILLKSSFFFEEEIYKIFSCKEDVEVWNKKCVIEEYKNYLGPILNSFDDNISTPFGCGIIKNGCWMDVPVFIKLYRTYLKEQSCLIEDQFIFEDLEVRADCITYKSIEATHIIFCDGFNAYKNPFFDFIPFSIAKGEQFLIRSELLKSTKIINKNIFLIPKGEDLYHVGSTFVWDDLEETITSTGRIEIESKLSKMLLCPYTIVEEKAGIRPTIIDRRPVVGRHYIHDNVLIFNGMGTKGISLAPFLANHFISYLKGEVNLMEEITVSRFKRVVAD